jgi:hypothetical protein
MYILCLVIFLFLFLKFHIAKIKSPLRPSGHKDWNEQLEKLNVK